MADHVPVPGEVSPYLRRDLYRHERAAIDEAAARLADRRPLRALDIGCGRGRTTWSLVDDHHMATVAFDIDAAIIAEARRLRPDIDFRVGDATDLGAFADASFDFVLFSYNGIDYLASREDRERCLGEIMRVLAPGGIFVYSSHNRLALLADRDGRRILRTNLGRLLRGEPRLVERSRHWSVTAWHGTPAREEAMLRAAGLELLEIHSRRKRASVTGRSSRFSEHWPYYVAKKPAR